MIKITGNDHNIIFYSCDCGTKGRCLVKPLEEGGTILVDVTCAICDSASRVLLKQITKDEKNTSDLAWSLVIENEVLSYEPKD
jgi:phosphoribosyl 1,2-cyclic phosphodiesterase